MFGVDQKKGRTRFTNHKRHFSPSIEGPINISVPRTGTDTSFGGGSHLASCKVGLLGGVSFASWSIEV